MPLQRIDENTVLDTDSGQTFFYPSSISSAQPQVQPPSPAMGLGGMGQMPQGALDAIPQGQPPAQPPAQPRAVQPPQAAPQGQPRSQEPNSPFINLNGINTIPDARVRAAQNNYGSALAGAGAEAQKAEAQYGADKALGQATQVASYASGGAAPTDVSALGSQSQGLLKEAADINAGAAHERELQAAAHQKAVARWQDWQGKFQDATDRETDPSRWWNSRSQMQKTMGLLSLAAGAWQEDRYGKNTALEIINRYVDQDIAAQDSNRAAKMQGLQAQRPGIEALNQLDQEGANDYAAERALRLKGLQTRIEGMIQEVGADSRRGVALAQIGAGLKQAQLGAENEVLGGLIGDEQAKAKNEFEMQKERFQEGNANYRARLAQSGENYRTELGVGARVSAADAKAAAAEKKAEDKSGETALSANEQTGLSAIDADGKPLTSWDVGTKETNNKIKEEMASGQQAYDTLRRLQGALKDDPGFLKQLHDMEISSAKSDAILQTIYTRIRGNSSERENGYAQQALLGYAGNIGMLLKGGSPEDLVAKQADELSRSVNYRVQAAGSPNNPPGSKVFWKPRDLPAEGATKQSTGQQLADLQGRSRAAGLDVEFDIRPDTSKEEAKAAEQGKIGNEVFDKIRSSSRGAGDPEYLLEASGQTGQFFKEISPGYKVDLATLARLRLEQVKAKTILKEKYGIPEEDIGEMAIGANALVRGLNKGWNPKKVSEIQRYAKRWLEAGQQADEYLTPPPNEGQP